MGVGDHGRFLSCCLVRTTLLVSRHPVKCPVLNGSVRYSAAVASAARNLPMQFSFNHRSSAGVRSEEHTSELQSRENLVCRLLLEKKNKTYHSNLAHDEA